MDTHENIKFLILCVLTSSISVHSVVGFFAFFCILVVKIHAPFIYFLTIIIMRSMICITVADPGISITGDTHSQILSFLIVGGEVPASLQLSLGSYHFLLGGGAVCLWGDHNLLGWSKGGPVFSVHQWGGPEFF